MSTSVNSDTGKASISRYISLLDVPDQKSALCQADNTRCEPLLCYQILSKLSSVSSHQMSWKIFQFSMVTFHDNW